MLDNSAEMLDCLGERLTLDLCCPDAYGKTDFFNTIGRPVFGRKLAECEQKGISYYFTDYEFEIGYRSRRRKSAR
jgi:hypothetical protein